MAVLDIIRVNTWAIFAFGALFTFCGFLVALRNYLATTANSRLFTIVTHLEAQRRAGLFDRARAVSAVARADSWSVLAQQRDETCAVMVGLSAVARLCACPSAWHAALTGSEWDAVNRFLDAAWPLTLVLRGSALEIDAPHRPYNGRKKTLLEELYRAMGRRPPRR